MQDVRSGRWIDLETLADGPHSFAIDIKLPEFGTSPSEGSLRQPSEAGAISVDHLRLVRHF